MKTTLRPLLAATFIFSTAASSHGAILLRIDARDPSQVFIHATTNASSILTSSDYSYFGFTLIDFLTGNDRRGITGGSGNLVSTASYLGTGPMTHPYNAIWTADYESGQYQAGNDLNMMYDPYPGYEEQIFHAGVQAFSGTMTINLSAIASLLPTEGTTGNIRSGNGKDSTSDSFGTYEVIPEPGTSALSLLGLGAVVFARARRMRKE